MNSNATVWIAEDDRSLRWVMEKALSRNEMVVRSFEDGEQLLLALRLATPEIIISDIRMPGIDGLEMLKEIHISHPNIPVIITTAHSDLDSAVAAYQGGAFEYLPKPFDLDELVDVARRAISFSQEQKSHLEIPEPAAAVQEIIGEAPAMQEVFRAIGRLSNSNITVLINGESGTGKELVAQALHKHSPRKSAKFIALLENYEGEAIFYVQPCAGLVELIEKGEIHSDLIKRLIHSYLLPLKNNKVDVIVLGCTHYVFIKKIVEDYFSGMVSVIDTGLAVALHVERILKEKNLASLESSPSSPLVYSNGNDINGSIELLVPSMKNSFIFSRSFTSL